MARISPDAELGTHGVSDEIKILIGEIVIGWTYLENTLQAALGGLLNLSEWKDIEQAYRNIRLPGSIALIRSLAPRRVPEEAERVRKLLDEIHALSGEREAIAHDLWWKSLREGASTNVRTPRKFRGGKLENFGFWSGHPVDTAELKSISERIAMAHFGLLAFFYEHKLWTVSPSPSTRPLPTHRMAKSDR